MSYRLERMSSGDYDLVNPSGTVVTTLSAPVSTDDEVVADAILDDIGVTSTALRSAIKALTLGQVEIVE